MVVVIWMLVTILLFQVWLTLLYKKIPMYQTNMLNISFNANDLRIVVYSILTIICLIIGVPLSKKIDNKVHKIIIDKDNIKRKCKLW